MYEPTKNSKKEAPSVGKVLQVKQTKLNNSYTKQQRGRSRAPSLSWNNNNNNNKKHILYQNQQI